MSEHIYMNVKPTWSRAFNGKLVYRVLGGVNDVVLWENVGKKIQGAQSKLILGHTPETLNNVLVF